MMTLDGIQLEENGNGGLCRELKNCRKSSKTYQASFNSGNKVLPWHKTENVYNFSFGCKYLSERVVKL